MITQSEARITRDKIRALRQARELWASAEGEDADKEGADAYHRTSADFDSWIVSRHMQAHDGAELKELQTLGGFSVAEWLDVEEAIAALPRYAGLRVTLNPEQIGLSLESLATVWVWLQRQLEAHGGAAILGAHVWGGRAVLRGTMAYYWDHSAHLVLELFHNAGELISWDTVPESLPPKPEGVQS